jgi:glycosyltransferase involved in cell wall biosynthesis
LIIVGDGVSRGELEALARELGVAAHVIFTGFHPDPVPWLAALDVFVMSSANEQAPISLLEAMACGVPVVATAAGDTREMLPGAQAPFVVPLNDRPAYSRALREMAANEELRRLLSRQNRDWGARNFSMEAVVARYEQVWRGAISSPEAFDLASTIEGCNAHQ